jgi:hypothetical protein
LPSAAAWFVARETKVTIAFFAGRSFQDGSGSCWARPIDATNNMTGHVAER